MIQAAEEWLADLVYGALESAGIAAELYRTILCGFDEPDLLAWMEEWLP